MLGVGGQSMMQSEREEDEVFIFTVSDEALEEAASAKFSIADCTDARTCPVPN
jgi:hypothetical protein